jgi:hypothetical protein
VVVEEEPIGMRKLVDMIDYLQILNARKDI